MAEKTATEILRQARAVIEEPEAWARGFYAYNAEGCTVDTDDPDACTFCMRGAVYRVIDYHQDPDDIEKILEAALPSAVFEREDVKMRRLNPITVFNDDMAEHADVLAAFDRAIALAEGKA